MSLTKEEEAGEATAVDGRVLFSAPPPPKKKNVRTSRHLYEEPKSYEMLEFGVVGFTNVYLVQMPTKVNCIVC